MSSLVCKNCGGFIEAVASINLRVVTFSLYSDKIVSGGVQAELPKNGSNLEVTWKCQKCGKEFHTKQEISDGVLIDCVFCKHTHPISEAVYTVLTPISGKSCLHNFMLSKGDILPPTLEVNEVLPIIIKGKLSA